MATNFKLKRSSVANKRPGLTNLELGELALNTYDGYLFTERNGLGITTVTNLTPWYENYGAASIFYSNSVGIGTTNPIYDLDVRGSIGGFNDLRAPHRTDVVTYAVTVATKDATHRYNGSGSSNGYKIDGEFSPFLVLTPGRTYRFTNDNTGSHPLKFYLEADKTTNYTTGVNFQNTYTEIVVSDQTPTVLHYQCTSHAYMGNAIHVNSNVVNSNYPAILRGGLNVSGAETILSSATVSDLTNTRVVYAGTSGSLEDSANLTFVSNTLNALNIDVDGLAELDDINVSAASTFAGAIDANGDIDVDGHTELDNVNISGVTTFVGNIDANGDIDVDGHTNLDNVSIAGVTTTAGLLDINAGGQANTFKVEDLTSGRVVLAGTGGELEDSGNLTFNGSTLTVGTNIVATNGTFSGNVSIAGTLTYQDVTNVDSIGIATARTGLRVLSGGIDAVGVITATQGLDAIGIQSGGVNITTGIITAINFTGTGNTVTYNSSTKVVSVSVGGAGGGSGGKFVENNTGIHTLSNVGIGTTTASDKLKVLGDVAFTGALKVSPLGLSGSNGNYLKSVGTGVTWAAFPTARTVGLQTATNNQTSFSFAYNVGFLDVYINGVKLTANEFTATNGTSVVLTDGAFTGDQVQLISFNTTATGGGGGGSGITDVVQDASPQLGGNLDLNSKVINGSGNIDYTGNFKASGIATATTFVGALTGNASSATILQTARTIGGVSFNGSADINLPGVNASGNQDTSGTAAVATNVTVSANNSTNETVYPIFVDGATGSQGAETDTGLNYNPSTGRLTAVSYAGDGSALTGISGSQNLFSTIAVSGQTNVVADSATDTLTLVAGSNMTITTNALTDTVTFASSGGGGSGNAGFSTAGGNFTVNAGVTTCLLYTSPSPRDLSTSRMPSSA